jgi:hypothetical protein
VFFDNVSIANLNNNHSHNYLEPISKIKNSLKDSRYDYQMRSMRNINIYEGTVKIHDF